MSFIILVFPESEGYGIPPESYIGPFSTKEKAEEWIDEYSDNLMRKDVCQIEELEDPELYVLDVREELDQISHNRKPLEISGGHWGGCLAGAVGGPCTCPKPEKRENE